MARARDFRVPVELLRQGVIDQLALLSCEIHAGRVLVVVNAQRLEQHLNLSRLIRLCKKGQHDEYKKAPLKGGAIRSDRTAQVWGLGRSRRRRQGVGSA